jgi:PAS domain S-box-containing protein
MAKATTKRSAKAPKPKSRRAAAAKPKKPAAARADRRADSRDPRRPPGGASRPDVARSDTERLRLELDVHRDELRAQNEDLRQTNAALLTAKERYAQLYDDAPIAYFTIDEAGVIAEANLAGAQLLEASRNFLFGRRFDELVVPSSRESFRGYRRRVFEHGGRPVHETVLSTGTRKFPVRIEGSRLAGPGFERAHCLLCVTDETERRGVEEERRQLEAKVAEAQRLESLGMLASGIAHDFNNILAIALTHTELMLEELANPEQLEVSAKEVRSAVMRAADLAHQMLVYSGRGPIVSETLDLSEVVRSMNGLLVSAAPKDCLLLELADDLLPIAAERARLQQIILNLVVNAAEAVSSSGRIRLRTRNAPAAPRPEEERADDRVLIEVSDDGKGMDDETRRRAFDPFFSTKFAGRGLGLAVVHGNVQAHGGTIGVESRPNGGTTVRVYLPVNREVARHANDVPEPAPWRGSGLVLVVDDEEPLRLAFGLLLARLGFDVCYACDGVEALEVVRKTTTPLVAVLLDLTMPRLDGRATLAELRRVEPELPVFLMSGFSNTAPEDSVICRADGYLTKPITSAAMADSMRRAVGMKN